VVTTSSSILNERRPASQRWLVVGADSLVGRYLLASLQLDDLDVKGTSRRWGSPHIHLDLAASPDAWALPPADIVVIAAAMPRIADCEADPATSQQINVAAPLALAQRMWKSHGSFVVFISSSGVFDGVDDVPQPNTPPQPLNAYGRQKVAAEAALRAAAAECGHGLAIIRPTKILADSTPLLCEWQAALAAGQAIHPHAWRSMAPVAVAWVTHAIRTIAAARAAGVWHLSAIQDVNFAEFARSWASLSGYPPSRVQPDPGPGSPPPRARLDMQATTERFGIIAPTLGDTLTSLQRNPA